MFIVALLSSLEIPISHGQQQDGFDLDGLTVPSMSQDDTRVWMVGGHEYFEQFAQQLLSEESDGRIDLKETQHQHIWTVLAGEVQQIGDLKLKC